LQLNATTNPKPNPNPIPNLNFKTNPNSTLKSEDAHGTWPFLVFRCPFV